MNQAPPRPTVQIDLPVLGMRCASCVARVERSIAKVPSVARASVNLATERARVLLDPSQASPAQVAAAIQDAGCDTGPEHVAAPPQPQPELGTAATDAAPSPSGLSAHSSDDATRRLGIKAAVPLTAGVALMALMFAPVSMTTLAPLELIVAVSIQAWAGGGFYRAAWKAARHGTTTMDTLVVLGSSVATGYSAFVTLWHGQAMRWGFPMHLYFESAVFIIALVLTGKWLEAKARKRASAAMRALMTLQVKTARVPVDKGPGDMVVGSARTAPGRSSFGSRGSALTRLSRRSSGIGQTKCIA